MEIDLLKHVDQFYQANLENMLNPSEKNVVKEDIKIKHLDKEVSRIHYSSEGEKNLFFRS